MPGNGKFVVLRSNYAFEACEWPMCKRKRSPLTTSSLKVMHENFLVSRFKNPAVQFLQRGVLSTHCQHASREPQRCLQEVNVEKWAMFFIWGTSFDWYVQQLHDASKEAVDESTIPWFLWCDFTHLVSWVFKNMDSTIDFHQGGQKHAGFFSALPLIWDILAGALFVGLRLAPKSISFKR